MTVANCGFWKRRSNGLFSYLPHRHSVDTRVQDARGGAGTHLAHKRELLSPANTVCLHHLPGEGKTKNEKLVDYLLKALTIPLKSTTPSYTDVSVCRCWKGGSGGKWLLLSLEDRTLGHEEAMEGL